MRLTFPATVLIFATMASLMMPSATTQVGPPQAPGFDVIPLPRVIERGTGEGFLLGPQTVIYVPEGNADAQRIRGARVTFADEIAVGSDDRDVSFCTAAVNSKIEIMQARGIFSFRCLCHNFSCDN